MTMMISALIAPIGIIAIVLIIMWGFIQSMFWLSDIVWNTVNELTGRLVKIKVNPLG